METTDPKALHQQVHGDPELPEGSTQLPNTDAEAFESAAPAIDPEILAAMTDEFRSALLTMTDDEQQAVVAWYPYLTGRSSDLVGEVMDTPANMMLHIRAYAQAQTDQQAHQEQQAPDTEQSDTERDLSNPYNRWLAECKERKANIAAAKEELEKREALYEEQMGETVRQWEAYLKDAKDTLKAAKAVPVPKRPEKE